MKVSRIFYSLFFLGVLFSGAALLTEIDVDEDEGEDNSEESQEMIWGGPGWYGGFWFNSEGDYNAWRNDPYYRNREQREWDRGNYQQRRDQRGGGGHGHR